MAAHTDLDTASINDKIVRTADSCYITAAGVPTALASSDRAWNLPVGTKITVTGTSPTRYFKCELREQRFDDLANPHNWSLITTLAITTPITTFLAGLDTFGDLARGAPTT